MFSNSKHFWHFNNECQNHFGQSRWDGDWKLKYMISKTFCLLLVDRTAINSSEKMWGKQKDIDGLNNDL